MRKTFLLSLEVVLLLGLSAPAAPAAGKPDGDDATQADQAEKKKSGGLFRRLLGPRNNAEKKSPPLPPGEKLKKSQLQATRPATMVDEAALERSHEEAVLFRRLAVCSKLMQIAFENRDEELLRQAEQLDERAWAAYVQRTVHLPSNGGRFETDEQILQRHLAKQSKPLPGQSPVSTAKSRDGDKPLAAKEE